MFEKFLSENIENFRQRYEGTYGFYRDGGNRRLLVKLTEIAGNQCNFVDARGITYNVRPDHPNEVGFEFLPPKSMWYNTEYGAMMAQRTASRQFQRGVTSKTLDIVLLHKGTLVPRRVDFQNLSAMYEGKLSSKEALAGLSEGRSMALSGQFAVDHGVVFLLRERIGTYEQTKANNFRFKLTEPDLWKTEISDAIKAMGCYSDIS